MEQPLHGAAARYTLALAEVPVRAPLRGAAARYSLAPLHGAAARYPARTGRSPPPGTIAWSSRSLPALGQAKLKLRIVCSRRSARDFGCGNGPAQVYLENAWIWVPWTSRRSTGEDRTVEVDVAPSVESLSMRASR